MQDADGKNFLKALCHILLFRLIRPEDHSGETSDALIGWLDVKRPLIG